MFNKYLNKWYSMSFRRRKILKAVWVFFVMPIFAGTIASLAGSFILNYDDIVNRYYRHELEKANSCYFQGDFRKAYTKYNRLAKKDVSEALNNLGVMYENGEYVEKDTNKAMQCYYSSFAGASGCRRAKVNYVALSIKNNTNRDKLTQIFKRAYENNDKELLLCAASCIDQKVVSSDELGLYKKQLKYIEEFFPDENEDWNLWECEKIIITGSPVRTGVITNDEYPEKRIYVGHSATPRSATYVYQEGRSGDYLFFTELRKGIAEWGENTPDSL